MPPKDFEKKQQKVGKRKIAPSTETRINVKLARLDVAKHEDVDDEVDGDEGQGAQSLSDALAQSRHHSAQLRKRSLVMVRRTVETAPDSIRQAAADVTLALSNRLSDLEPVVRGVLLPVLSSVLSCLEPETLPTLAPVLAPYLAAALTRLHTTVRLDAVAALAIIIQDRPHLAAQMLAASPDMIGNVVGLLEPSLHGASSPTTLLGSVVPAELGLAAGPGQDKDKDGKEDKDDGPRVPFALRRVRMSATHARVAAAFCLRRVFLEGRDDGVDGATGGAGTGAVGTASVLGQQPGMRDASHNPSSTSSSSQVPVSLLPTFAECALQAVQLWLDCGPGEAHEGDGEKLERLALVAHVLHLAWVRLLETACSICGHAAVQGVLLLACGQGAGEDADGQVLATLRTTVRDKVGGTGDAVLALVKLTARAIHAHVMRHLPVRLSRVTGSSQALPLARLQCRLVQLACGMLPAVATVAAATAHVSEMEAAGVLQSKPTAKASASGNRFAMLSASAAASGAPSSAPATTGQAGLSKGKSTAGDGKHAPQAAGASSSSSGPVDAAATATADAYRHAWRAAWSSAGKLRKAAGAATVLRATCHTELVQLLEQVAKDTVESRGSSSSSMPTRSPLATLVGPLMECAGILVRDDQALDSELLACLTKLNSTAPAASTIRSSCMSLLSDLLQRGYLATWPGSTTASNAMGVEQAIAAWVQPLPRFLWALGASSAPQSVDVALSFLRDCALRVGAHGPASAAIREAARACTPLLYTVKLAQAGQGGEEQLLYGPFLDYSEEQQVKLLGFLEASRAAAQLPLLRRALAVVARAPRLSSQARSVLLSSTTRVLLGDTADDTGALPQDSLSPSCGAALGWLATVMTGQQGQVTEGKQLQLAQPSSSDAGQTLTSGSATALPFLCDGDDGMYADVLQAAGSALQMVVHAERPTARHNIAAAVCTALKTVLVSTVGETVAWDDAYGMCTALSVRQARLVVSVASHVLLPAGCVPTTQQQGQRQNPEGQLIVAAVLAEARLLCDARDNNRPAAAPVLLCLPNAWPVAVGRVCEAVEKDAAPARRLQGLRIGQCLVAHRHGSDDAAKAALGRVVQVCAAVASSQPPEDRSPAVLEAWDAAQVEALRLRDAARQAMVQLGQ